MQNGGAGSIAKEDAGVAIGPVDDRAEFVGPDDEGFFGRAGGDELPRQLHAVEKTGAGGRDVEAGGFGSAEGLLYETRGGGEGHVGCDGGDNDEIEVFGFDAGILQSIESSFDREIARRLVFRSNAALFDSRALNDPFVIGIDHALQVGVGQDFLRNVFAGAGNGDGADGSGAHSRA